MATKTVVARKGEFIVRALERALKVAQSANVTVELIFNDVALTVRPEATVNALITDWNAGKVRPL